MTRISKSRSEKGLLLVTLGTYDLRRAVVNENATKQQYHWLKEEK